MREVSPDRVRRMIRKELRQMLRDIRMRAIIFVAPIIQLVVFGYAVSTDVRDVPTWVVDHDRSAASRELVDRMVASGYFQVAGRSDRSADLTRALDDGSAIVGLEIPPRYGRDLAAGNAVVQVLVDGTNSNTAIIAQGYLVSIIGAAGGGAARRPIQLEARAWYNPGLLSRVYNVPAVMGALLMIITMLLTSLSVVREREVGTWEQLVVSPVSPAELMLGKTLPVALVGLADLVVVSAVAVLWFDIPFRGSPMVLLLAAVPYLVAGLAFGLVISTVSRTQQEAFMSMFLVLMPAVILSGFMFPISSMPVVFQAVTLANPLRHFIDIVRGVFLKGTGLPELWPQILALTLLAVVGLRVAVLRFRRMVA